MTERVNDLMMFLGSDQSVRWMMTLLHFLWQGTFVGVIALVAATSLKNASASIRYAVYGAAFLSLPVCVIITLVTVENSEAVARQTGSSVAIGSTAMPVSEQDSVEVANRSSIDFQLPEPTLLPQSEPPSGILTVNNRASETPQPSGNSGPLLLPNRSRLAPWFFAIYVCGVICFLLRFALALRGGHRLRRESRPLLDSRLLRCVREQAQQMGLRVVPIVAYCQRVTVPTVIGVLRPMILLPASISTGLSSQELSAVLSHELAHVRRYDLWMNLTQRLVESLLFFHPVVWFLSRRISAEREVCCDDLVVQTGHQPMNYAGALLRMAELCVSTSESQLATLAAGGHSSAELERRIERLMNIKPQSRFRLTRGGAVVMLALLIAVASTPTMLGALAQSRNAADESDVGDAPVDVASSNVPTTWDFETGKNVRWKMPLGSAAMRAPLVHGDHVYIGTNNESAYLKRFPAQVDLGVLLCFRKSDGKLQWQHSNRKLATGRIHDWPHQGVTSRPCVRGERLWYISNRCEIICLDTQGFNDLENDGPVQNEESTSVDEADVVWRFDMMAELGVSPHNMSTCTVAVWKDRIFVVTGNGVGADHQRVSADAPSFIAVDKNSGQLLWADDSPGRNVLHGQWGSPVVADLAGKTQVIFPGGDGWLYSFDPLGNGGGKGKLIWKFDCNPKESIWKLGGTGTRNNLLHAPTIHNGLVYVAMGQDPEHGAGPGRVWCIDPCGSGDVSPELVFINSDASSSKPDRREQACIAEQGDLTQPNPNSKAVWQFAQQDVDGNGKFEYEETMSRSVSTISIKDDLLFVSDIDGILHCLDRRTGTQHWGFDLRATVYSTPTISGDYVYIGDEDGFVSVFGCSADPRVAFPDGEPLQQMSASHSVNASAVVDNDTLFIATRNELVAIAESPNPVQHQSRSDDSSNAPITMVAEESDQDHVDEPKIQYPHCIVEADDLAERSLSEAIAQFNLTARESPIGVRQPPITERETRNAIAKFAGEPHVTAAVRAQLNGILESGKLPPNIYFRRFTRFDDEQQMRGVWWVRLCIEGEAPPLISIPIRATDLFSRPYTQLERRQNSKPGVTLINRFSSYFEDVPNILLLADFPDDKETHFIDHMRAAIDGGDLAAFESLCDWHGVDDSIRSFAKSEFQILAGSTIHNVRISPGNFRGQMFHWSAYQNYQPNTPVIGYLDIEYSPIGEDATAEDASARKTLSLEMGDAGDDFRLINYIEAGERKFPKALVDGLSIRGHVEPLADGTFLVTSLTTNPGTLISAHLANEEVWQRDFNKTRKADAVKPAIRVDFQPPNAEMPEEKQDPADQPLEAAATGPSKSEPPMPPSATLQNSPPMPSLDAFTPSTSVSQESQTPPEGPRTLVATIFGTTIYLDQLASPADPKVVAKFMTDAAKVRQRTRHGERLLKIIAGRIVEDYVRVEKLEVSDAMKQVLWQQVLKQELPDTSDTSGTISVDQQRNLIYLMGHASLKSWVVCKSLYVRYGGRVEVDRLGLWISVDGRNQLMREYLETERIQIHDEEIAKAFWKAANVSNFADRYPKGEQLRTMMATPPDLENWNSKPQNLESEAPKSSRTDDRPLDDGAMQPKHYTGTSRRALQQLNNQIKSQPDQLHGLATFERNPMGWKWKVYLPAGKQWQIKGMVGQIPDGHKSPDSNNVKPMNSVKAIDIAPAATGRILELSGHIAKGDATEDRWMVYVEADAMAFQGVDLAVWPLQGTADQNEVADYILGNKRGLKSEYELGVGNVTSKVNNELKLTSWRFRPAGSQNAPKALRPGFVIWIAPK